MPTDDPGADELEGDAPTEDDGVDTAVDDGVVVADPDAGLSPRQIFGGFVLLAALVALLVSRRKRS